jgi:hypothetical protein
MPYISTEEVAAKRQALKVSFPEYKFSVRRRDLHQIRVAIISGPIQLLTGEAIDRGYRQVNHFWIEERYEETPEIMKVLCGVRDILTDGQKELVYDGDYGSVPNYYVSLNVGEFDKNYEVK